MGSVPKVHCGGLVTVEPFGSSGRVIDAISSNIVSFEVSLTLLVEPHETEGSERLDGQIGLRGRKVVVLLTVGRGHSIGVMLV